MINRRDALLALLFGSGLVGLRALATGLPAWFVLNPRNASAADLQCALAAIDKLQYLIVSTSSMGDPLGNNCPGTYDVPAAIHPEQPEMVQVQLQLGGRSYGAAQPWNQLNAAVLGRTCFFHHATLSSVHGEQPKVMRLLGKTSGGEMVVSAYAKHLAGCLGTVQTEPVAVGARGNASELVSFTGRALPSVSPTQLRQLLTGSVGRSFGPGGGQSPLVQLRSIRDKHLDRLNELAKTDATQVQKKFLDAFATSQAQVRQLAESLADTLSQIDSDNAAGQALAAAALIAAKVTPVVTMRIPFGGDNHSDSNLQAEVDQTVTGVQGIQAVMDALASMGLTDQVTFATWNVFGRNLNGIAKVEQRQGRDHYPNHCVSVLIGKNVAPGVVGGILPVSDRASNGALGAADIDSASGAGVAGGDVPRSETHVALARTLGVALGIPATTLEPDFVAGAGGKVVSAALTGV
jgi:hypothetical protein